MSGIYITEVRGVRGALEAPPKKQKFFARMRSRLLSYADSKNASKKRKPLPKTQENQKGKNNRKRTLRDQFPAASVFLFIIMESSRVAHSGNSEAGRLSCYTPHASLSQSLRIRKLLSSLGTARISITQSVTGLPFIPSAYSAWISKEEADSPRRIRVAATSISSRPKGVL